jgi:hypothetical protein
MAINTCSAHDVIATKRCPVCHRALCSRCKTQDGCCSAACYGRRRKFGAHAPGPVRRPKQGSLFGLLFKLALLGGIAYAAAKYFGQI